MLLSAGGSRFCTSQPVGLGAEDKFVLQAERGWEKEVALETLVRGPFFSLSPKWVCSWELLWASSRFCRCDLGLVALLGS